MVLGNRMECIGLNGQKVPHGETFVPGPDYCTMCKCDKGRPHLCRSVLCQSPQHCKYFRIGETCCDFICLDDMLPPIHKDDRNKGVSKGTPFDLTLRTLGSAITAILSLSLLLFLIYRLRQRKRKDAQRRCFEDSMELEATSGVPSDSCHSNPYCHGAIFGTGSDPSDLFCNLNSSSLMKPPYNFHDREPPPSYNEAVANDFYISMHTQPPQATFTSSTCLRLPAIHVTTLSDNEASNDSSFDERLFVTSRLPSLVNSFSSETPTNESSGANRSSFCDADAILSDQVYEETPNMNQHRPTTMQQARSSSEFSVSSPSVV